MSLSYERETRDGFHNKAYQPVFLKSYKTVLLVLQNWEL